jgi:hypothetical protein
LSDIETAVDDKKYIVSMRLINADRVAVRSTAARLFVRESELYRFAVHHLLNRLHKLHDDSCTGSDLLPLFLEFRDELNIHLGLKKHQLFKIVNSRNSAPEKFVAMMDIELLLMPQHSVRQRLQLIPEAQGTKQADTQVWLKNYLCNKYQLGPDRSYVSSEDQLTFSE